MGGHRFDQSFVSFGQTPNEFGTLAPQLAWHFEQAGLADQAAAYHLRAGKRAAQLAAHEDDQNIPLPDLIVGIDVRILSFAWQSFALWQLGYPDRASQCLQDALTAAQDGGYSCGPIASGVEPAG